MEYTPNRGLHRKLAKFYMWLSNWHQACDRCQILEQGRPNYLRSLRANREQPHKILLRL